MSWCGRWRICRHVSGSLERFLIERGERVLRIATHLTARERKRARQRGKSDAIDALHVARAVVQEGLDSFPAAHLEGPELDLRLLVDHRERLVGHRVELNSTLLWHLHDLWPQLQLPGGAFFSKQWSTRIAGRLARAEQTMRVRIARDMLRRLRELTQTVNQLEREITRARRAGRATPAHRTWFRAADRRQARRRDRRRAALRHASKACARRRRRADPSELGHHAAPPARPRRQPPDSTLRCTASSSPARAATSKHATTSNADAARARPPAKPSAASRPTSHAASGACCSRPPPGRNRTPSLHQIS